MAYTGIAATLLPNERLHIKRLVYLSPCSRIHHRISNLIQSKAYIYRKLMYSFGMKFRCHRDTR